MFKNCCATFIENLSFKSTENNHGRAIANMILLYCKTLSCNAFYYSYVV